MDWVCPDSIIETAPCETPDSFANPSCESPCAVRACFMSSPNGVLSGFFMSPTALLACMCSCILADVLLHGVSGKYAVSSVTRAEGLTCCFYCGKCVSRLRQLPVQNRDSPKIGVELRHTFLLTREKAL